MTLLIFDLDGTLVDCKELHQIAFRKAVEQQVPGADFDDDLIEGLPTTEKIKVLKDTEDYNNHSIDLHNETNLKKVSKCYR